MALLEFVARVAVGWLVVSVIVAGAWSIAATRHKLRRPTLRITGAYPACIPVHPVPTQADVDAVWLDAWPSAVDDDALMHAEFVSIISAEWHWPEDAR